LRRSAFQEAIVHLGKAIAMADKGGDIGPRATAGASRAAERLKLQTAYGRAVMWGKRMSSDEARAVFVRARELAAQAGNVDERFETYHGLYVTSVMRGELGAAHEVAETFRREAESCGGPTEAGVGDRLLGLACYCQGDFTAAKTHCEDALRIYDPERDRETRFRFGMDTRVGAIVCLGSAALMLGDIGGARKLIEEAVARAVASDHVPELINAYGAKAGIEISLGHAEPALRAAEILEDIHRIRQAENRGEAPAAWARARLGDRKTGIAELRRAITARTEEKALNGVPFFQGLLAELEAEEGDFEGALAQIDDALATAHETGEHRCDAFLHRLRGELLLKRDPANPAAAEDALQTALAIAERQGGRFYGLLAALSLAKLYRSTAGPAEAHAVLAPAFEGFSPSSETPEITEAEAVLAALAKTDELKNAGSSRRRRLQLQTAYGRAVAWSKGFGSDEARAAFARAGELAKGANNVDERFEIYHVLYLTSHRAEVGSAQKIAETFHREAENLRRLTELAVGERLLGLTSYLQGDFRAAKAHFEGALRIYDPERDRETRFRFGLDTGFGAIVGLAPVAVMLGDIEGARQLIEQSIARAVESDHVPELLMAHSVKAGIEMNLGHAEAALRAAEALEVISRNRQAENRGEAAAAWARARLHDRKTGISELGQVIEGRIEEKLKDSVPFYQGLLAELEAEEGDFEGALAQIDDALATAHETGELRSDAFLHRLRGELLLKRDPGNPAAAEDALQTALAIAERQGGRFYGLLAALSLAKFYQATGRMAEARAVLAPALERLSPTPEMPEIAEAQSLLATLA
jgi:tetratricopeptide (TPR) repeat protein